MSVPLICINSWTTPEPVCEEFPWSVQGEKLVVWKYRKAPKELPLLSVLFRSVLFVIVQAVPPAYWRNIEDPVPPSKKLVERFNVAAEAKRDELFG